MLKSIVKNRNKLHDRFGSLYGARSDKSNGLRKIIDIDKKYITYFGNPRSVRKYINVIDAAKILCKNFISNIKINILLNGKKSFPIKSVLKMVQKMYLEKKK